MVYIQRRDERREKSAQQKCFKLLKPMNKLSAFMCVSAKQTSLLFRSLPCSFSSHVCGFTEVLGMGKVLMSVCILLTVVCWRKGTPHRHSLPTEPRAEVR